MSINPKTIGTLTVLGCIIGPNLEILTSIGGDYCPDLVILAWKGDEFSRGQTWWRTDGRTHATTIPGGRNWPGVKKGSVPYVSFAFQCIISKLTSLWGRFEMKWCHCRSLSMIQCASAFFTKITVITDRENSDIKQLMAYSIHVLTHWSNSSTSLSHRYCDKV